MADKALQGIRVLEYCRGISGAYCTKLMGDLGAEVIKLEAPHRGDDTRRAGPFAGDEPHIEKSGLFLFLNTSKLGITLDPRTPAGKTIFERLATGADVVVEDWPGGTLDAQGLGYDRLRALNAGLIVASLTPFGLSGPNAHLKAHGLNISHASGQGNLLPMPSPNLERAPVKVGGHCTDYDSGQTAALGILAALFHRAISGRGQFIEVSQQEAVLNLQRIESVVFANAGEVLDRRGPDGDRRITKIFECKDGWVVAVAPLAHQLAGLARLLEEFPDMREHTRAEVCARGQALACPISPMNSPQDVAASPQLRAREFFTPVAHPVAGVVEMPTGLCRFSQTPIAIERAAPVLGQHNDMIYRERLGIDADAMTELRETGAI